MAKQGLSSIAIAMALCACNALHLSIEDNMKSSTGSITMLSRSACPLPQYARWCHVNQTKEHQGFEMAVLEHDGVGDRVCRRGKWDDIPLIEIEKSVPKNSRTLFDIGANAGWYTLLFAYRGWNVHAFEPMPMNYQLLEATLCRYPELQKNVRLHKTALGPINKNETCGAYSKKSNIGDATICCPGEECGGPLHVSNNSDFALRGDVSVRTLDSLLREELHVETGTVGYVKIDVEGYECGVIQGAMQLLEKTRPLLVQSEINTCHSNACSPEEYLMKYKTAGYSVHENKFGGPEFPFNAGQVFSPKSIWNYYMQIPGVWKR